MLERLKKPKPRELAGMGRIAKLIQDGQLQVSARLNSLYQGLLVMPWTDMILEWDGDKVKPVGLEAVQEPPPGALIRARCLFPEARIITEGTFQVFLN